MKKIRLDWVKNGTEFELPELTVGDIRETKRAILKSLREYKDLSGDKNLNEFLEQESAFELISLVLKRVDPNLDDATIDNHLSLSKLNELTDLLMESNQDIMQRAGVKIDRPHRTPSKP